MTRRCLRLPLLTVLTYHRVGDPTACPDVDAQIIDATPAEFDQQLRLLRRHFSLVGIAELRDHFVHGKPLPPNPAVISFDDGYRDCFTKALPILRRHSAKAVFFIATGYPTQQRLYWWDKLSLLARRTRKARATLKYPSDLPIELADPAAAARILSRVVKDTYGLDLERFLEEVAGALDVSLPRAEEQALAAQLLMSWDELRALRCAGMDVQSHTRSHRVLQTVPAGELRAELQGAKADLEEQLGVEVSAIAYPVGRVVTDDPHVSQVIRQAGYALGFSNGTGVMVLGSNADPLAIARIAVERALPPSYLRAAVTFPFFAYPAPAARHRLHRAICP